MNQSILSISHLNVFPKNNSSKLLVNDVSFDIKKGSIMGIVGESGSGKSLSMRSLMHILPENLDWHFSTFEFNGIPVKNTDILPISMIFQDPMTSLNPLRTVGFHLLEIIDRYQKNNKNGRETAIKMLEKVGINNPDLRMQQYPFELSGGMRQRIMIAMALLSEPKVLIADEPTTALDVTIQMQILSLILSLQKELNLTIVIVSHDFGVIAGMCDSVTVMYQGQIVEQGFVNEVFENPQHDYTKRLLALAAFDVNNAPEAPKHKQSQLVKIGDTHFVRKEIEHG